MGVSAVCWLESGGRVAGAFEVGHSTSIYSGIVRMLELALGTDGMASCYFLVAPDRREADVRAQFARPAFSRVAELNLRYLPYSELETHRASIARFGQGLKPRSEEHTSELQSLMRTSDAGFCLT